MKLTLTIEMGDEGGWNGEQILRAITHGDYHFSESPYIGDSGEARNEGGEVFGKWEVSESMRDDIQQDSVALLLWDYLKRDPEHKDRRQTRYGTKTKQGLYLSISNILKETGGLR